MKQQEIKVLFEILVFAEIIILQNHLFSSPHQ